MARIGIIRVGSNSRQMVSFIIFCLSSKDLKGLDEAFPVGVLEVVLAWLA